MEGGELFDRMATGKFQEADAAQTVRQILRAVSYLHEFGIVHRDLKPENLLYDVPGGSHLKLTDFGFSTWWKEGDANLTYKCGSARYLAPEVIVNGSYTNLCDLWSIGVIAFILLSGYLPFDGSQ